MMPMTRAELRRLRRASYPQRRQRLRRLQVTVRVLYAALMLGLALAVMIGIGVAIVTAVRVF
jgi:hypothetical protein